MKLGRLYKYRQASCGCIFKSKVTRDYDYDMEVANQLVYFMHKVLGH